MHFHVRATVYSGGEVAELQFAAACPRRGGSPEQEAVYWAALREGYGYDREPPHLISLAARRVGGEMSLPLATYGVHSGPPGSRGRMNSWKFSSTKLKCACSGRSWRRKPPRPSIIRFRSTRSVPHATRNPTGILSCRSMKTRRWAHWSI